MATKGSVELSISGMNAEEEDLSDSDTSNIYTEAKDEVLAKDETRAVFWLRLMVMFALLSAAALVAGTVFWLIDRALEETLQAEFSGSAEKLFESFRDIVLQKMGALASLGSSVTAYARGNNRTFPFVTMNDFQERAATTRVLSSTLTIEISPLVREGEREQWELYSTENAGWYQEGFEYQDGLGFDSQNGRFHDDTNSSTRLLEEESEKETLDEIDYSSGIAGQIFVLNDLFQRVPASNPGPWYPIWQSSPVRASNFINFDRTQFQNAGEIHERVVANGTIQVTDFSAAPPGSIDSDDRDTRFFASLLSLRAGKNTYYDGQPLSLVFTPIFDTFKQDRKVVSVMFAIIDWASYFEGILSPNSKAVVLVISNPCYGEYTYSINGNMVKVLGEGDQHSPKYDSYKRTAFFAADITVPDGTSRGIPLGQGECKYQIEVYPSDEMYNAFHTRLPWVVAFSIILVFLFSICMFLLYDRLVERRQKVVMNQAERTTAIVAGLFPESIRKRLMGTTGSRSTGMENGKSLRGFMAPSHRLKTFLSDGGEDDVIDDQPIADLFPHSTVAFLDIANFTSWSSTREPAQVFVLLQTIYRAFDVIAKRHKVFKVETIGDCYVAVTGLPNPQARHAIFMARFAWECLQKMGQLTKKLETMLGPDTTELGIRIGLHSGPVTAGVLRGDKSRFQLFGDTVNTAARMESTGEMNRIQVSQTTASLLIEAGKESWLQQRDDEVVAKGKGVLRTCWLVPRCSGVSETGSSHGFSYDEFDVHPEKRERLIQWMVDLLSNHIRKVVAMHQNSQLGGSSRQKSKETIAYHDPAEGQSVPLDEVVDIIQLPKFNAKTATSEVDYRSVDLDPVVVAQLHEFVSTVASNYRKNPFHNFEHACHVTMCVEKFLQRIKAPDLNLDQLQSNRKGNASKLASQLHDYTHGLTTDPMTPLAILFSALIHDVDHRGCSNSQLEKEEEIMAETYKGKSTAEQNSLDISWGLFMSPMCKDLRVAMFASQAELKRFRQLLVNVVLATDIFDEELNGARRARWNRAFSSDGSSNADLRATIVIEHIIQASDVSHTMQHWHVYRKWNRRLFLEMYHAFKEGRMPTDPNTFWYQGELGFFDNYVIPLAKKLKDCNVFGVSSDECLNYAVLNRAEWEARGEDILASLVEELVEDPTNVSLLPGQVAL